MNADRLLELYEQISDASDAIARLRDVVLEVGVRGKLNEQDEAETVSPEFLNETSDPEFPDNWRTLNFGKYCNIEGGNQPPKSQFVDSPRDGYVRLFQIRDLGERPVPVYIPETSTKRFSVEGEILIGRYGASVGKVFWAQNGAYNVALAKFIFPENAFLPDFSFRLLKSSFFQKALEGASRTAQAGFNKGDLAHIDFPLPPLSEQHRIVAKVDELMALCDQLEQARAGREAVRDRLTTASLARLTAPDTDTFQSHAHFALQSLPTLTTRPDQIKTLRQTILNLAVRGKLVAQDAKDEPVRVTLKRSGIALSLREQFNVPQSWAWAEVGQVSEARLGKMLDKAKNKGTPRRYLRNANVRWFDFDLSDLLQMPFEDEELAEFALRIDDVLICEGGEPGRAAIWDGRDKDVYFQKALHRVRFHSEVDSRYFLNFLKVSAENGNLKTYFTGTGIQHFTGKALRSFALPLPPLAEQHRIVAKVDALMALCDQLETSLTTTATTRSKLLNALLHEALEPTAETADA